MSTPPRLDDKRHAAHWAGACHQFSDARSGSTALRHGYSWRTLGIDASNGSPSQGSHPLSPLHPLCTTSRLLPALLHGHRHLLRRHARHHVPASLWHPLGHLRTLHLRTSYASTSSPFGSSALN